MSETGRAGQRLDCQAGFSLFELLLALFLLVLATMVTVVSFEGILGRDQTRSAEAVLKDAITDARFEALKAGQRIALYFDPARSALVASQGADELFVYTVGTASEGESAETVKIQFYFIEPREGTRGFALDQARSEPVSAVYFDPDRSSTPFIAEIQTEGQTTHRIAFDPFSNLPISPLERDPET